MSVSRSFLLSATCTTKMAVILNNKQYLCYLKIKLCLTSIKYNFKFVLKNILNLSKLSSKILLLNYVDYNFFTDQSALIKAFSFIGKCV